MREPQHHAKRAAITLLEVLIAIGILSVGLASVFALFPAARHLSGKALNYDRSAALAENAINDFLTRGFHNPRTWVPSPLATNLEWPFSGFVASGVWPFFGSPQVIIFDPLDTYGVIRDPTQPPDSLNAFPSAPEDLPYQPVWGAGTQSSRNPTERRAHLANANPAGHLPSPPSHPFQYEPSYGTGVAYSKRLVDDLFRLQDDVAYSLDGLGPNDFPENIFASGSIGQRQFSGRYSCLFMLQRIGADWQHGQAAHLTVVVFRDRDPTRSPILITPPSPPDGTWRIRDSSSPQHPMPNALADFRVKDVLKPGTLVYDAGTLSWWKAMYAVDIDPVTLLPNNDNVTSLATAVASADLVYNQNQCVWTAMGPNARTPGPLGPLFAFPDAVAVSHRQIVLAGDDRWSE